MPRRMLTFSTREIRLCCVQGARWVVDVRWVFWTHVSVQSVLAGQYGMRERWRSNEQTQLVLSLTSKPTENPDFFRHLSSRVSRL